MEKFLSRYRSLITAVLSGFDRIVFRGVLQPLRRKNGMYMFLVDSNVRLLDFGRYAERMTERVKTEALAEAESLGRPVRYLETAHASKEDLARDILARDPVDQGLICVFKTLEPCMRFVYQRSPDRNERGLKLQPGKCLHLYKYYLHPRFGFMSIRLQTWFPFDIQICMNGREWLAWQLTRKHRNQFKRVDNCLTEVENPRFAQRLLDQQLRINWPNALDRLARSANPAHRTVFRHAPMSYYWSAYQTEWATDLLFRDPVTLSHTYPGLVNFAMRHFQSPDVMRFLARKAPGNFTGELVTSFKDRAEGVRVKHWVRGNSIKMYDKAGSVLRVETTIGDPTDFKVFRPKQDAHGQQFQWLPLRKGVADLHRRAQVSQRSNDTYLDALAAMDDTTPCSKIFDLVARPACYRGRRVRALHLDSPDDVHLIEAASRGEFATSGFRNRDLRALLFPHADPADASERKRLASRVTRLLRLLRAHNLIEKVQHTSRYRLTARGRLLSAASSLPARPPSSNSLQPLPEYARRTKLFGSSRSEELRFPDAVPPLRL